LIAEQQLGKVHPLGHVVDVLLGGGRCNFLPQNKTGSCREDDTDLYEYAKEKGWAIARNREEFDEFELGKGKARIPMLGNFAAGLFDQHPTVSEALLTVLFRRHEA
jgi:alkaline phosphatase